MNKVKFVDRLCARFSNLAYLEEKALSKYLKNNNHEPFKILKNGNDYGFAVMEKGKFIISFRGSDDVFDWGGNVNILPLRKKHYGWIHRGFYNSALDLVDQVETAIKELNPENKPIYLTGHSLGGAIACVMSIMLTRKGFHISGVVTFGTPKPGKSDFRKKFRKAVPYSKQFMFEDDPVPKFPRSYLFWRHPGKFVIKKEKDVPWWKFGFAWFGRFSDHGMDGYEFWIKKEYKESL